MSVENERLKVGQQVSLTRRFAMLSLVPSKANLIIETGTVGIVERVWTVKEGFSLHYDVRFDDKVVPVQPDWLKAI